MIDPPPGAAGGRLGAVLAALSAGAPGDLEKRLAADSAGAWATPRLRAPIDAGAKALVIGGRRARAQGGAADPDGLITGYLKFPTAFAPPGATLRLPGSGLGFDVDAVLGVVIGRRAHRVQAEDAWAHVAGVTLMADVTERAVYQEEARTNNGLLAKNHPGLSPLGPAIRLAEGGALDPVLDPAWEISLEINGQLRQRFSVADLAHGIEEVLSFWSPMTLEPGDLIGLGGAIAMPADASQICSPAAIEPGDNLKVFCDAIGVLEAFVTAEDEQ